MMKHTTIQASSSALRRPLLAIFMLLGISACGGGGGGSSPPPPPPPPPPPAVTLEQQVRSLATLSGVTGDPLAGRSLPSISDPVAQLGKLLFFSKSLSGDMDTACASCHHPVLGGGDGLALPVGTGAVDPDIVGPGRERPDGLPNVGRHSQSVFNVGLYDAALFWDSRVESIGKESGRNGAGSGIRTPESALNVGDPLIPAGSTLVAAQARMPVTVPEEMRGSLLPGASEEAVRTRLAERIGNYGAGVGELVTNNWLAEFQTAFSSSLPADQLITFDNIALAIGEYQRSMVFVATPWSAFINGDNSAISDNAKNGAVLFYDDLNPGVGCADCHGGDFFTDERNTVTGFPQIGPGKGDGATGDADFGREQQTANSQDRFMFRTPTLLNLLATGPYTHNGAYDLNSAMGHYFIPEDIFNDNLTNGSVCRIEQFENHPDCATLFPNTVAHSNTALARVVQQRSIDASLTFPDLAFSPLSDAPLMGAFLQTLTDPCTLDRACLAPWIPDPGDAPDENQLDAMDANGNPL